MCVVPVRPDRHRNDSCVVVHSGNIVLGSDRNYRRGNKKLVKLRRMIWEMQMSGRSGKESFRA